MNTYARINIVIARSKAREQHRQRGDTHISASPSSDALSRKHGRMRAAKRLCAARRAQYGSSVNMRSGARAQAAQRQRVIIRWSPRHSARIHGVARTAHISTHHHHHQYARAYQYARVRFTHHHHLPSAASEYRECLLRYIDFRQASGIITIIYISRTRTHHMRSTSCIIIESSLSSSSYHIDTFARAARRAYISARARARRRVTLQDICARRARAQTFPRAISISSSSSSSSSRKHEIN